MAKGRYVSYLRVSTDQQGRSGLGLRAQRETVATFLNGAPWQLVGKFVEVETGTRKGDHRPELDKASETGVNGGSPSAKVDARGSVNITLSDSLKDKNVKTDTSGMFKDVQVGRGRPAKPPENTDYSAVGRASAGF